MTQTPSRYNFTSGGSSCIPGLTGDQAECSPEVIFSPVRHQANCCHHLSLTTKPWGGAQSNKLGKEVSEPGGQWTPQTSPATRMSQSFQHTSRTRGSNPNTYCDNGKVFSFFTLNFDHVSSLAVQLQTDSQVAKLEVSLPSIFDILFCLKDKKDIPRWIFFFLPLRTSEQIFYAGNLENWMSSPCVSISCFPLEGTPSGKELLLPSLGTSRPSCLLLSLFRHKCYHPISLPFPYFVLSLPPAVHSFNLHPFSSSLHHCRHHRKHLCHKHWKTSTDEANALVCTQLPLPHGGLRPSKAGRWKATSVARRTGEGDRIITMKRTDSFHAACGHSIEPPHVKFTPGV